MNAKIEMREPSSPKGYAEPGPAKIEMRDPSTLRPLPIVKGITRWAPDSDEFKAFKLDIRENGIRHPLQITVDGQIVDGWTRCLAARAWQIKEVPCQIVSAEEAHEIILRELLLKRNLTKGQLAYAVQPFWEEAHNEKRRNRTNKGQFSTGALSAPVEMWFRIYGFSERILRQATDLHRRFKSNPALHDEWEPKILDMDNPIGLGAALAGIEGELSTKGKARAAESQLELFSKGIAGSAVNHLRFWQTDKKQAIEVLLKKADKLKPEQCEGLAEMHSGIAKIYREKAKANA